MPLTRNMNIGIHRACVSCLLGVSKWSRGKACVRRRARREDALQRRTSHRSAISSLLPYPHHQRTRLSSSKLYGAQRTRGDLRPLHEYTSSRELHCLSREHAVMLPGTPVKLPGDRSSTSDQRWDRPAPGRGGEVKIKKNTLEILARLVKVLHQQHEK